MGKRAFTEHELKHIKRLLRDIRSADRSRQKGLRAKLRSTHSFYIRDFATDQRGFAPSDVDDLVARGVITVLGKESPSHPDLGEGVSVRLAATHAVSPKTAINSKPSLPASFKREDLENVGFRGWRVWDQLRASEFSEIPNGPAAYVVYSPSDAVPVFLDISPGGHFKGRDPTVQQARLAEEWVTGAKVIYIGKADDARQRLRQFARFGAGEPVGHWGGRCIWQLAHSAELLVAWHTITWKELARAYERRLLALFADLHSGRRPFANLTG